MRFSTTDPHPREALDLAGAALRVSRALVDEEAFRAFLDGQPGELSTALARLDVSRALLEEARQAMEPPPRCSACPRPEVDARDEAEAEP